MLNLTIREFERLKAEIEEEKNAYIREVGVSGFTKGLNMSIVIINEHITALKGKDK